MLFSRDFTLRLCFCAEVDHVKPVLQALLLADKIYEDSATHKKIIAGVFNQLFFVPKLPTQTAKDEQGNEVARVPGGMQAGSPSAYFSITDFQGKSSFVLRYIDLDDSRVLLQLGMQIACTDPLETIEVVVPMPLLPTPRAGVYALELLCENEPIGAVRVKVVELKMGESS
jgi:hypothetical protein